MSTSVKSLLLVTACAALTVLAADAVFARVVKVPPREYETTDSLRDYQHSDPDTLVLGSSYARSFFPMAEALEKSTPPSRLAIVPIEGGKLLAYDWLLQHRLAKLIDEKDAAGAPVRPSLRRLLIVTNYWDICDKSEPYPNLPARAWALPDYAADVAQNGVTAYNTNFVDQRFSELTFGSSLLRDRGVGRILRTLRERVHPKTREEIEHSEAFQLQGWISMVEGNDMTKPAECPITEQAAALTDMLSFAEARKLEVTFVLWMLIPKAVTESTMRIGRQFRTYVEDVAVPRGARVIDLQDQNPLTNEDFRKDLDHLEEWGNEKLRDWALEGPLAWLKRPPGVEVSEP